MGRIKNPGNIFASVLINEISHLLLSAVRSPIFGRAEKEIQHQIMLHCMYSAPGVPTLDIRGVGGPSTKHSGKVHSTLGCYVVVLLNF